jgi:hypothetical protein
MFWNSALPEVIFDVFKYANVDICYIFIYKPLMLYNPVVTVII